MALADINRIQERYISLINKEINRSNPKDANVYLSRLKRVNPNHAYIRIFKDEINNLDH